MADNSADSLKKDLSEIKKMIEQLQKDVNEIKSSERTELSNIKTIRDMGVQELQNLSDIVSLENKELSYIAEVSPKRYSTIIEWKSSVWEDCPDKKTNESKTLILFVCNQTNSPCSFESCPKNKLNHSSSDDD